MNVREAYEHIVRCSNANFGRFYQPGSLLALGKGKLFSSALFSIFDPDKAVFLTARGLVLVLTHECDVEAENSRLYNEDVLVCPIVPLEALVEDLSAEVSQSHLISFLTNLGARNISRLIYLPPSPPHLEYGGVLFLNQITNTHVSAFSRHGASSICALTGYGLQEVEYMLENHLLRPKAERIAFVPGSD